MAGTSKRGKAVDVVEEDEDELNPRSKSRTRKQYSPDAQTKELSPPSEEPRRHHLLISNGGAICFLDLEQSKDEQPLTNADYVPPLAIIASLNLMENHLPVLAGLFKVGSDAYMIGGRKHIRGREKQPLLNEWPEGLKGTSHAIHRLSLAAADNDDTTLIITSSKAHNMMMKKLKSPKIWPIVEEIDGQIHVFDSAFDRWSRPHLDWTFSHEVLNTKAAAAAALDGRPRSSWRKIGVDFPPELKQQGRPGACARCALGLRKSLDGSVKQGLITSHLVLGKRIYAVVARSRKHLVFDSETNKWEDIGPGRQSPPRLWAQHVWDILDNGIASCVGEFSPYYVVIGISERRSSDESYYYLDLDGVHAAAFIVRGTTGEVVCRQPLRCFFQGPVQPDTLRTGTVIKVDEEGKTMCAILNARAILNGCEYDSAGYLFIYTFSVEILPSAVEVAQKLRPRHHYLEELVRVVPRERFVYMTDARLEEDKGIIHAPDFTSFQAIQACFV